METTMQAHQGDRLILEGTHIGDGRRVGVILEVRGAGGAPPYLVRWMEDDHVTLVFPGPASRVETPHTAPGVAAEAGNRPV
jgi:hypothetical protein